MSNPDVRQNHRDGVFNKYIATFYKEICSPSVLLCRTYRYPRLQSASGKVVTLFIFYNFFIIYNDVILNLLVDGDH